jgi:hypothetical protein
VAFTFVGFYRPSQPEVVYESWRTQGAPPAEFREKVAGFRSNLPPTCKLFGSWYVTGLQAPGVMVVEAESFADLQHINQYFNGWFQVD